MIFPKPHMIDLIPTALFLYLDLPACQLAAMEEETAVSDAHANEPLDVSWVRVTTTMPEESDNQEEGRDLQEEDSLPETRQLGTGVWAHASAALQDTSELFVYGGYNAVAQNARRETPNALILDLCTLKWRRVPPPPPEGRDGKPAARAFHSAVVAPGGRVVVFGGRDGAGRRTDAVLCFDRNTSMWTCGWHTCQPCVQQGRRFLRARRRCRMRRVFIARCFTARLLRHATPPTRRSAPRRRAYLRRCSSASRMRDRMPSPPRRFTNARSRGWRRSAHVWRRSLRAWRTRCLHVQAVRRSYAPTSTQWSRHRRLGHRNLHPF